MYVFRRKIHSSWLLAWLFAGVTSGIIGSSYLPTSIFTSISWLFIGLFLAGFGLWRKSAVLIGVMIIAGLLIGFWRGGNYARQVSVYRHLIGKNVTFEAKVTDDPDRGKKGETVLRLGGITVEGRKLKGSIWASLADKSEIKRGDVVEISGKLGAGFGSFSASTYRAKLISAFRPIPGDVAGRARDWFSEGVRRGVPEPEASLGVGYLVGQKRALPENLDKALKAVGLTHVVVASGYNLTILVGISRRVFLRISKFTAAFLSGGLVIGFMAVTGMSPSMSRAGLVTGLSLLAWYYGRRFHPLVLLSLASALTLLINPQYGQNDLGWQLSFTSFAGVLVVAPLLQDYFYGDKKPSIVRQVLGETVSAWICTVPLIVLDFGQFSNVAIVANLLVLPLVPLAMLLTFIAGVGALVLPSLAVFIGFPATIVLAYMNKIAEYLGGLSYAQTALEISPLVAAVYYLVLISICIYLWRATKYDFVIDRRVNEGEKTAESESVIIKVIIPKLKRSFLNGRT